MYLDARAVSLSPLLYLSHKAGPDVSMHRNGVVPAGLMRERERSDTEYRKTTFVAHRLRGRITEQILILPKQ